LFDFLGDDGTAVPVAASTVLVLASDSGAQGPLFENGFLGGEGSFSMAASRSRRV